MLRLATLSALWFALFLILGAWSADTARAKDLNDEQRAGRRIFQQRCAVCHTPPMVISRQYGPFLNRETVAGREGSVRSTIMDGETGLMPGFRYGMEPSQVEAIIEYLKTVEKPSRPVNSWVAGH